MTEQSQFTLPVRVYYEDTDAAGVVYYANYFRFFERCRSEWVRSLGYDQRQLAREHDIVFVVRGVSADYLKPARLDDLLSVHLSVVDVGRARATLSQRVLRENELLVDGTVRLVCVSAANMKPKSIPDWLRAQLEPRS
ncbi:MAG: tol-pal system-associated acyl-CoA thioesterase [Zoogloeaceae bacterium]|jgi:acyl-CoA thioester hydrolase|nr:tol-pal system-associated acyl-CoA thioesterase [Zoogloeaceae bacterium]